MKIKIDENLPAIIAEYLNTLGHDADTVYSEGLVGCTDAALWENCKKNHQFLITQDLDFSDKRKFLPGTHEGILILRFKEPGRIAVKQKLLALFSNQDISEWKSCFVVITEKKIRVTRQQ